MAREIVFRLDDDDERDIDCVGLPAVIQAKLLTLHFEERAARHGHLSECACGHVAQAHAVADEDGGPGHCRIEGCGCPCFTEGDAARASRNRLTVLVATGARIAALGAEDERDSHLVAGFALGREDVALDSALADAGISLELRGEWWKLVRRERERAAVSPINRAR